jgi:hypothetical protein
MKVLLVGEGPSELAGALKIFVERVCTAQLEIEQDRVSRAGIHAHHGKGKGYFKRAVRWMLEAQKRGFDAIVLLIDQDGLAIRGRELDQAHEYAVISIPRALGVAIKTFDAWMLSDETALTSVLKYAVTRQPDPESISNPKQRFQELLDESGIDQSQSATYAALATVIQINVLELRCPKGFAPFAARVRGLEMSH